MSELSNSMTKDGLDSNPKAPSPEKVLIAFRKQHYWFEKRGNHQSLELSSERWHVTGWVRQSRGKNLETQRGVGTRG